MLEEDKSFMAQRLGRIRQDQERQRNGIDAVRDSQTWLFLRAEPEQLRNVIQLFQVWNLTLDSTPLEVAAAVRGMRYGQSGPLKFTLDELKKFGVHATKVSSDEYVGEFFLAVMQALQELDAQTLTYIN